MKQSERKIRFKRKHFHDGIEKKPGQVMILPRDLAEWLVENNIATLERK